MLSDCNISIPIPPMRFALTRDCMLCVWRRVEPLLDLYGATEEQKEAFFRETTERYQDHGTRVSPPEFMRELYQLMGQTFPDRQPPFWQSKRQMNDRALELHAALRVRIQSLGTPFYTSLRMALAATAIDFTTDSRGDIERKIDHTLRAQLAIDHAKQLRARLHQGVKVLYLANLAGEIVFDRLFIRKMPIGVDVTVGVCSPCAGLAASGQDADYVDMRKIAKVLENGCQAPNTLISSASERFDQAFREADVVIAKGQSNLEALANLNDPRLFILFTCQCLTVGERLGILPGQSVVVNPCLRAQELAE